MPDEIEYPVFGILDGAFSIGSQVTIGTGEIAGRDGYVIEIKATGPYTLKYRVDVDGRGDAFWFFSWEIIR